jgi:hypothetical protein
MKHAFVLLLVLSFPASAALFPLALPQADCPGVAGAAAPPTPEREKAWENLGFKQIGDFAVHERFAFRLRGGEGLTVYNAPDWADFTSKEIVSVFPVDHSREPDSMYWPDQIGFRMRPRGQTSPVTTYYPAPSGDSGLINPRPLGDLIAGSLREQLART